MSWRNVTATEAPSAGGVDPTAARPRLASIVYFRATAILLIVSGHSYVLAGIRLGTGFDDTLSDLVRGATGLFVFISGFLFDHVYGARYSYRSFLLGRARKLLVPYCILTLLAGVMFSNWAGGGFSAHQLFGDLFFGDAFEAYWYIPFIMAMFALAPLHRRFMALKTSQQAAIVVVAIVLAGLVQRPLANHNAVQSVVFYLPIYLSGLFLSLHRETMMPIVRKNWPLFLLGAILLAATQALGGQSGNLHKPFFAVQGFEPMGIQKLALSFGLVGLFSSLPLPPAFVVRVVADTSFAIFFLHGFVVKLLERTDFFRMTHVPWLDLAITVVAITALCALIALALRALLKTRSAYLVGY